MKKKIELVPSLKQADKWLDDGVKISLQLNKDLYWLTHSVLVGELSKKLAKRLNLNEEYAYIIGLLHDIGKQYHPSQPRLLHAWEGYKILMGKGYPEIARYCLTHCFTLKSDLNIQEDFECLKDKTAEIYIKNFIKETKYTDYDRIVQLSDAMSGTYKYLSINEKLEEKRRKYPKSLIDKLLPVFKKYEEIQENFENKMNGNISDIINQKGR